MSTGSIDSEVLARNVKCPLGASSGSLVIVVGLITFGSAAIASQAWHGDINVVATRTGAGAYKLELPCSDILVAHIDIVGNGTGPVANNISTTRLLLQTTPTTDSELTFTTLVETEAGDAVVETATDPTSGCFAMVTLYFANG